MNTSTESVSSRLSNFESNESLRYFRGAKGDYETSTLADPFVPSSISLPRNLLISDLHTAMKPNTPWSDCQSSNVLRGDDEIGQHNHS